MDAEYIAETRLRTRNPRLHKLYTKSMSRADVLLTRYKRYFPEYTDHSILHSMEVTRLCNHLITDRATELGADALYILLMAALLHDIGMGVGSRDLKKYFGSPRSGHDECLDLKNPSADLIREHHQRLSAQMIQSHYRSYGIPDAAYAWGIAAVAAGHRREDLTDREAYPPRYRASESGETVNLAYLAAVLRLADEFDISAARNLETLYHGHVAATDKNALEFGKHRSVGTTFFDGEEFVVRADAADWEEYRALLALCGKLRETLEDCREVAKSASGRPLPIKGIRGEISCAAKDMPLQIQSHREEETLRLTLSGRIDTLTAPLLEQKLAERLGAGVKSLCLDVSDVGYISSAGLRVILSAQKKMDSLQGGLLIQGVQPQIMEIFEMTGFRSFLFIVPARANGPSEDIL